MHGIKNCVTSLEQPSAKNREDLREAILPVSCLQIFGPEVGQKLFFDETMKQVVKDVLSGQNCLVYTYGITNSGKTYTIQGKGCTRCWGPVEGVVFCLLPVNPQLCCCPCCRHHPGRGDSASLLGNHLQQRGGPAVQGHGPEACPVQRGDLAGQQAGAPGGDQEAADAAGGPLGGKHGASGGSTARGEGGVAPACSCLLFPSRRSC